MERLAQAIDRAVATVRGGASLADVTGAARRWAAGSLGRDVDVETGLPNRTRLLADLAGIPGVRARLELLSLHSGDGLAAIALLGSDPGMPHRIARALRAAAAPSGARAYRLDGALYAFLGPVQAGALTPAAAAQGRLAAIFEHLASSAVRGEARLPDEAADGPAALRLAHERMRARSRWQHLSSERQLRDVLLQLLSERRSGGAAVALPRVAAHAIGIGRRLGLSLAELDEVVRASELQDMGMLAVPESVLHKREALTPEEWNLIRQHPVVGERILAAAPALAPVARIVRSCYERYDGSGYPDGLTGEAIPLGSRVIAVCVAYDAMTSPRHYRAPMTPAAAFEELNRCAGEQFDPIVVAAFLAEMGPLDPELDLDAAPA
jgi:two-component system, cell cycle response regulator